MNPTQAQQLRKTYSLYYYDTTRAGKGFFYPTGMGFRNDTLFIELSAPITVVGVRNERDSALNCIGLRDFRDSTNTFFIGTMDEIRKNPINKEKNNVLKTDTTKENSFKKVQQKAKGKS